MIKKFLLIAASCLLLIQTSFAADTYRIFVDFDVDSTSYVYCDTTAIPAEMSACASGTAANDGWVPVNSIYKAIQITLDQLSTDTAGIDYIVYGRLYGETIGDVIVAEATLADAVEGEATVIVLNQDELVNEIRVGLKINTADDGTDTGADIEEITVVYQDFSNR